MKGIIYDIDPLIQRGAKEFLEKTRIGNSRPSSSGTPRQKIQGLTAEWYVSYHYETESPFSKDGGYCPYDLDLYSKRWDVKTKYMKTFNPEWCTDLFGSQKGYQTDGYIFCVANDTQIMIVAWMWKEEYLKNAEHKLRGTQIGTSNILYKDDNYEMKYKNLREIDTFCLPLPESD